MIWRANKSRGDTLVEVLLSAMILSSILAAAYTLTNRATLLNRVAFERTEVSNLVQQQVELLRAARDNSSDPTSPWNSQIISTYTSSSPVTLNCKSTPDFFDNPGIHTGNAFYLDGQNLIPGIYIDDFYHVWIEAYSPAGSSYVDFYVNACWENIDESENLSSGVVMRLQKAN